MNLREHYATIPVAQMCSSDMCISITNTPSKWVPHSILSVPHYNLVFRVLLFLRVFLVFEGQKARIIVVNIDSKNVMTRSLENHHFQRLSIGFLQ